MTRYEQGFIKKAQELGLSKKASEELLLKTGGYVGAAGRITRALRKAEKLNETDPAKALAIIQNIVDKKLPGAFSHLSHAINNYDRIPAKGTSVYAYFTGPQLKKGRSTLYRLSRRLGHAIKKNTLIPDHLKPVKRDDFSDIVTELRNRGASIREAVDAPNLNWGSSWMQGIYAGEPNSGKVWDLMDYLGRAGSIIGRRGTRTGFIKHIT